MPILTAAQRQQFDQQGYVVVDDVLDVVRDIGPVVSEYEGVLDAIARSLKAEPSPRCTASCPFRSVSSRSVSNRAATSRSTSTSSTFG
jgi:hypothetical protein